MALRSGRKRTMVEDPDDTTGNLSSIVNETRNTGSNGNLSLLGSPNATPESEAAYHGRIRHHQNRDEASFELPIPIEISLSGMMSSTSRPRGRSSEVLNERERVYVKFDDRARILLIPSFGAIAVEEFKRIRSYVAYRDIRQEVVEPLLTHGGFLVTVPVVNTRREAGLPGIVPEGPFELQVTWKTKQEADDFLDNVKALN